MSKETELKPYPAMPRLKPLEWNNAYDHLVYRAACPMTGEEWFLGFNEDDMWYWGRPGTEPSDLYASEGEAIASFERWRNNRLAAHLEPGSSKPLTAEEIEFTASDESNHHDWNDLRLKDAWAEGFKDGAKWAIGRIGRAIERGELGGIE